MACGVTIHEFQIISYILCSFTDFDMYNSDLKIQCV